MYLRVKASDKYMRSAVSSSTRSVDPAAKPRPLRRGSALLSDRKDPDRKDRRS